MGQRVGEIVESSSAQFVAQCYTLHSPPALGSLVKVSQGQIEVLAVVCEASTGSIHPGRTPVARGLGETTEEDLYANNPQIDKLLRTLFQARIVGYSTAGAGDNAESSGTVHYHLPERPPQIHAFVYECGDEDRNRFSRSLDFLNILVSAGAPAGDEIITSCLQLLSASSEDPRRYLVGAGKALSLLMAGEPQRLNAVLRGLRP